MNNRMPKILTSPTKNARQVVNPELLWKILSQYIQKINLQFLHKFCKQIVYWETTLCTCTQNSVGSTGN